MWYGPWLEQQGRQPENLRERQLAFELDPLNAAAVAGYANALFHNGRSEDATQVLQRTLEIYPDHTQFGLGDTSAALAALERGFEARDVGMNWIKVAPAFAPLRNEPRFTALLERMGLR